MFVLNIAHVVEISCGLGQAQVVLFRTYKKVYNYVCIYTYIYNILLLFLGFLNGVGSSSWER